jgi:hypothetical protein
LVDSRVVPAAPTSAWVFSANPRRISSVSETAECSNCAGNAPGVVFPSGWLSPIPVVVVVIRPELSGVSMTPYVSIIGCLLRNEASVQRSVVIPAICRPTVSRLIPGSLAIASPEPSSFVQTVNRCLKTHFEHIRSAPLNPFPSSQVDPALIAMAVSQILFRRHLRPAHPHGHLFLAERIAAPVLV